MNELSRRMMVTGGNVTGITDQLVAEGLVDRVDVDGDRRAYRVRLTPKGRKLFNEMAGQHESWIVDAFSGLTDKDIATLHKLLGKVKDHATHARRRRRRDPKESAMSAQQDRFVHDRLPPRAQWPELRYDRPELQFPDRLNLVEELLDKAEAKGFGDRPLLRSSRITLSYADVRDRVDRICRVLTEDLGLVPGNRVLLRGGNSIGMALALAGRGQGRLDRGGHHAAAARARAGRHHRQGAARRWPCATSSLLEELELARAGPAGARHGGSIQCPERTRIAGGAVGRQARRLSRRAPRPPTTSP